MSKKLIAVASAAALALSALVAAPAGAAGAFAITATGMQTSEAAGISSTTPLLANVPSSDVQRYDSTSGTSTGTLIRLAVTTTENSAAVTATSTGSVKIVTASQWDANATTAVKSSTGVQSVTATSDSSGSLYLYVYTTSTSAGTVTVTQGANSRTFFVKGVSPITNAYKLNFTAPASAAISGKIELTGTVTDMFGNLLTLGADNITTTTLGGSLTGTAVTENEFEVNSTTKVHTFNVPSSTTASALAVSLALAAPAVEVKTAFGSRAASQFFSVNAVDLSAQVTALTAQVAALKADYNALAAKWNKRVASKTAPKKAVTLK
jgi:hypothetical protein